MKHSILWLALLQVVIAVSAAGCGETNDKTTYFCVTPLGGIRAMNTDTATVRRRGLNVEIKDNGQTITIPFSSCISVKGE